jgi:hypothetical protein
VNVDSRRGRSEPIEQSQARDLKEGWAARRKGAGERGSRGVRKQELHRAVIDRLTGGEEAPAGRPEEAGTPTGDAAATGRFLKMVALRKQQILDRVLLDEN